MSITPTPRATSTALVNVKTQTFIEESSLVRLEGRYFCFDPTEAAKRSGVYEYRSGDTLTIIEVSTRFGHPSVLAYKVLQAIFRKMTEDGPPYHANVKFTMRELNRLVGRKEWGGSAAKQLNVAIGQLSNTIVDLYKIEEGDGKRRRYRMRRFNVINVLAETGEDETDPSTTEDIYLGLHQALLEDMQQGRSAIFNWDRLRELEPMASTMYKRVSVHLANLYENELTKDNLRFEKSYEAICAEWLGGVKVYTSKSRIMQKLGPHFTALINAGLLRKVSVEDMSSAEGKKIIFLPGAGFFVDYENFFLKRSRELKFETSLQSINQQQAIDAVAYFYQGLGIKIVDKKIMRSKEISFMLNLMGKIDGYEVKSLIDFAHGEARKTNFKMATSHSIEVFIVAWKAELENQESQKNTQSEIDHLTTQTKKREAYDNYITHAVINAKAAMDQATLTELEMKAKLNAIMPETHLGYKLTIAQTIKNSVRDSLNLPDYEEWSASQK